MKKLLAAAVVAVSLSGCQTLHYECVTESGEKITASSRSWLWDEELEGFSYDHKLGKLEVKTRKSGSDAEAIKALSDTIRDLAAKLAAAGVGL